MIVFLFLVFFLVCHPAEAYLDPGPAYSVFSVILAPVVSFLLVVLAFLVKPIKKLFNKKEPKDR